MVRMVRVIVDGENEVCGEECLARRLLPITVEPGLTMVMALEDSCMACGLSCLACGESCLACEDCCEASEASNKDDRMCPDSSTFLRNLESLRKEEMRQTRLLGMHYNGQWKLRNRMNHVREHLRR